MHNSLNQDELSALTEVSHVANLYQKPKLGKRYSILFSIALVAGAVFFGVPATWDPVAYISMAISPSLEVTDSIALFIRIRGIISLTLMVMLVFFQFKKIEVVRVLLFFGIIWICFACLHDFYRLYLLGLFISTTSSTLHLASRPMLIFTLVIMYRDLTSYLKAYRDYKINNELQLPSLAPTRFPASNKSTARLPLLPLLKFFRRSSD